MSWVQHMRKALEDRRQPVLRGIVEAVDGRVVQVRVPDGRLIPAAPLALVGGGKGIYHRYATGDDVVLLCDQGDPNGAVCLASPRTAGQDAPDEVDHEGLYIYEDRVEVRSAEGDDVQGVVMRPVLDGLYSALGAVSDLIDVLASPETPPGTAAQNAALLTAVRAQIGLPAVGTAAVLSNVLNDLDTSRAGQGTGPYCSDMLRAVVDGPLGGGGGGGGSQGATLEDIDDAIQAHLAADHADLATDADIAALDARIDALEAGGAGVTSVNGQTGVVVLDAADVGADASGTASGLLASHVGAADPHTGYVLESREGAANGIATLNGSTLVPRVQLGSGSSGFLTYGGTWSTLVSGDIPDLSSIYAPAAGATSIVTLGTITTGAWQGGTVAVAYGGTGATTPGGARTNLGLAIGTDVQAYSAQLDTLAATAGTDGDVWRRSGGAWGKGTLAHTALSSLAWASAGHTASTGTGTRIAGWATGTATDLPLGGANGVASLDGSGTLTASELPSNVPTLGGAPVEGDISRHDGTQWQPVSELVYLASDHVGVGTDGDVDLDGTTAVTIAGKSHTWSGGVLTLTRSPSWGTVTVSASCTIDLNGEIFRARKLEFGGSSLTLTVHHDGLTATGGSSKLGRSGGYTDATSANSGAGGNPPGNGSSLTGVVLGGAGGNGGAVGASAGGTGGTVSAGTDSAQSVAGRPTYSLSLMSGRASNGAGWRGGAGGGGGRSSTGTGGGGGSGGGFALVMIGYLDVGTSCTLAVTANGGAGAAGSGGNAGGGGGGGGGIAVLVRAREKLASGATVTVTADGGAGGAGSGTGSSGAAGSAGLTNDITLG